jgi:hypothetical protein
MIPSVFETHERESLVGLHGMIRNLGDEGHILIGGQARDQIVELKYESHRFATIGGQCSVIESAEFHILEEELAFSNRDHPLCSEG